MQQGHAHVMVSVACLFHVVSDTLVYVKLS